MNKLFRCLTLATALLAAPNLAAAQANIAIAPAVRVQMAPPPMRVEVRPPMPAPNHVWTNGSWRWQGGQHTWAAGRWEPLRPGHVWVDSHWVQERGQWSYYDGRWAASQQPYHREVVVATAPPPPQYEMVPPMHEPRQEWIGGHWEWQGERHIWMPGRYEERPDHGHWQDHRWERMDDGKYRFHRGQWHRDEERREGEWHHGGEGPREREGRREEFRH